MQSRMLHIPGNGHGFQRDHDDPSMYGDRGFHEENVIGVPQCDPALHPSSPRHRTNFKAGGYVPPSHHHDTSAVDKNSFTEENREEYNATAPRYGDTPFASGATNDPDMPFDVLNDILRSNSSQTFQASENTHAQPGTQQHATPPRRQLPGSSGRNSPPIDIMPDESRFKIKYSDPSPFDTSVACLGNLSLAAQVEGSRSKPQWQGANAKYEYGEPGILPGFYPGADHCPDHTGPACANTFFLATLSPFN